MYISETATVNNSFLKIIIDACFSKLGTHFVQNSKSEFIFR